MEGLKGIIDGLATAVSLGNLLYAFIGVTVGTLVGVLPGIGPAMAIGLLLPLTFALPATASLIMFGGIYYGVMYGGSTTSILLRTPGEAGSIFTAIEGNRMARAGRAGAALATSAIGSFVAGCIATLTLAFAAPYVVAVALRLGPADYLALMVVALLTVGVLLGESPARGIASLALGLAVGLVGLDAQSGVTRFSFGHPMLAAGISEAILVVGLFAVGGALYYAGYSRASLPELAPRGRLWLTSNDWRRSWGAWLRGTAFGFPLGAIPVGGAELPTFLSYAYERRRHSRRQGKARERDDERGIIECVAGPEAANNANAAGVLMPLLTLGLPTSATAAVLLVAFQQYGLRPGPLLLASEPELVWGLIAALFVGNAMLLVLNLPLVGLWAKVLFIPAAHLNAAIVTFAMLSAYTLQGSVFGIYAMLMTGLLGFAFSRFGYPIAPLIIAAILGPMAEVQLRRTLEISGGDASALIRSPFAAGAYVVIVLLLVVALWVRRRERQTAQKALEAAGLEEAESSADSEDPFVLSAREDS